MSSTLLATLYAVHLLAAVVWIGGLVTFCQSAHLPIET
jgi:uncharacterized membrane protein